MIQSYIDRVERAIDFGNDQLRWKKNEISIMRTKLTQSVFDINGMSTPEVRMLLNELVEEETNYLEVGIHRGSTFVSAMFKNKPKSSFAIDHFGGVMFSDDIKNKFLENCANHDLFPEKNFVLFHEDSFRLKQYQKNQIKNINLYFYDGGHSAEEHKNALSYYYENLSDTFILIVDDWVHLPAVEGTRLGIEENRLRILKEWELGFSQHLQQQNPDKLSWHNGLYIAVVQK